MKYIALLLLVSCGKSSLDARADGMHQTHCHDVVSNNGRWQRCENDEVVCYLIDKGISCLNKRDL